MLVNASYLLKNWSFADEVVSGLDLAVSTMKKGEFALVIVSPSHGFGNTEKKTKWGVIPPCSTLYYEVEMINFQKVSTSIHQRKCKNIF